MDKTEIHYYSVIGHEKKSIAISRFLIICYCEFWNEPITDSKSSLNVPIGCAHIDY